MSSGSSGNSTGGWGSSSSSSGGWGNSGSGSGSDGWTWQQPASVQAGDDNYLLRLDKEAFKVLNSHLTNRQVWHLAWAVETAERVKEGEGPQWTPVVNW